MNRCMAINDNKVVVNNPMREIVVGKENLRDTITYLLTRMARELRMVQMMHAAITAVVWTTGDHDDEEEFGEREF